MSKPSRAPAICGVILAAGDSTRMGREKALLPWPPTATSTAHEAHESSGTFLSQMIRLFHWHTELVLVVVGKNAGALAPTIYAEGAFLVENPHPERGQFSSLQVGMQEVLNRGRDAALVTLVDRPPVARQTVTQLVSAFRAAIERGSWAAVPEYADKHGHPIIFDREMIEALLKAPANSTARQVEHAHQQKVEYVPVNDPLIPINVNTPAEYAALAERFADRA